MQKLLSMNVQHSVKQYDVQPTPQGGILVYLSGLLQIVGETNAMNFTRIFLLTNTGQSYYGNFIIL